MDKIFSARVDESVLRQIGTLARKLNTSKKAVIEAAIKAYSQQTGLDDQTDILAETFGAWMRPETPETSIHCSRAAFNKSMKRHQR